MQIRYSISRVQQGKEGIPEAGKGRLKLLLPLRRDLEMKWAPDVMSGCAKSRIGFGGYPCCLICGGAFSHTKDLNPSSDR